ncbi:MULTISPECIES: hypothetical protein [Mycobacterium avium complex (MAC)]|uniref:hypothetical protein n=1 Tax=Mycobacterium avium complex (MAC) TaxID=120793 RepID=UPI000213ADBF|nr:MULTISPECIES: hypothetical protein [Mycobacterium avium complex (MAC)]ELP46848.1 hypothetical protein D522_08463 [Mycobacterium avium subsp. paratuberculosis S5]ETB10987.1 hypothetical protein O980_13760 [Mycobacterium avium subsp. paratuberculosis 08-8281]ETB31038.1 hypothetical protein O977_15060 [Mycobacterium avium subsp. paratuberculosis 10-5975]ETB38206.1 hypothetical protein O975_15155 [Mycobacterium avium subsp. paratuberculosis 11-1786]ETB40228.1 hypothetical protein N602_13355 [My
MSHSEFGHRLRRICSCKPDRRGARRPARHDVPPHASIEMLWKGPGIDMPGDGA